MEALITILIVVAVVAIAKLTDNTHGANNSIHVHK